MTSWGETPEVSSSVVMAVASLCALACGTRAEDAEQAKVPASELECPLAVQRTRKRVVSLFRRGLHWLQRMLFDGKMWEHLWLAPEPFPNPPPGLKIVQHAPG